MNDSLNKVYDEILIESDDALDETMQIEVTHDSPVQDDEYSANFVRERFYWLKPARDIAVAAIIGLIEVFSFFFTSSNGPWLLSLGIVFMMVATLLFAIRTIWIWKNWLYELDPFNNSVTLYMPGMKWLFVREHGRPTIPMQGTAVTEYSQTWIEQWFFRRSFTVTIDNELQTDDAFHDMHFVKDATKLRNILVWYNNIVQRREREEGDINRQILEAIRGTNDRLDKLINALIIQAGTEPR